MYSDEELVQRNLKSMAAHRELQRLMLSHGHMTHVFVDCALVLTHDHGLAVG